MASPRVEVLATAGPVSISRYVYESGRTDLYVSIYPAHSQNPVSGRIEPAEAQKIADALYEYAALHAEPLPLLSEGKNHGESKGTD